jgi:hypothetical protein
MPTPAFAQQSLEEFLVGARKTNSDLQVAAATIEQQEGESLAALGRSLPSLTARGIYTRNEFEVRLDPSSFLGSAAPAGGPSQSFIIQPLNQLDATVQLDVPLIDLAAWQRVTAQHAAEPAAHRMADVTMTDVQMQVARNYYQLVGSRSLRQSAERTLEAALTNLGLTRMTGVLLAIASISLIVGGIGIANIMLVSVRERTREIGVRRAVGATRNAILMQFLIEAIVIASIGGLVGLALGAGIIGVSRLASDFRPGLCSPHLVSPPPSVLCRALFQPEARQLWIQ